MSGKELDRRAFLKLAAGSLALAGLGGDAIAQGPVGWIVEGSFENVLERRPLRCNDVSGLFHRYYFDTAPDTPELNVEPPMWDEAASLARLQAYLTRRAPKDGDLHADVLSIFNHPWMRGETYDGVRGIVVHPEIRAGIAALKGTIGEPAIDGYLLGIAGRPGKGLRGSYHYEEIAFVEPLPFDNAAGGRAIFEPPSTARVWLNRYAYHDFEDLMPVLAHEVCHVDPLNSIQEEICAIIIECLLHLEHLSWDAAHARKNSIAVRVDNMLLFALLNCGEGDRLGIGPNSKVPICMPDGNAPFVSWEEMAYSWPRDPYAGPLDMSEPVVPFPEPCEDPFADDPNADAIVAPSGPAPGLACSPLQRGAINPIGPTNPIRRMWDILTGGTGDVSAHACTWNDDALRRFLYDIPIGPRLTTGMINRAAWAIGVSTA